MQNAVIPVDANNSRHSREGGNPVYFGFPVCQDGLDSRLRGNDGGGEAKRLLPLHIFYLQSKSLP